MSSQPERTPDEHERDSEFGALLRAVARPDTAAPEIADHLRMPAEIGLDQRMIGVLVERAPGPGELIEQHYRVERELGRGGMGIVYEALNVRTGKRVALKWMSVAGGLASERGKAMSRRFRREARAAAAVRHPNIVDIYDVAGSDGAPFLVMELLEGEPLRAFMARTRASWEQAVEVMLPVLHGVGAMHRAGVIHRDLKPDNIFLCRQGEGLAPVPKVLDFGVAAMQDTSDGLGSLTRSGAVLGTPSYMALEQLTGKAVDARADLYALGVVLYELLTGTLPFVAANAGQLAVLQATGRPVSPAQHNAALHGAREALLLKALARDPADRFASAEAFADALRSAGRGRLPVWRRKPARALAAVLGLWLLAGCYWWWRAAKDAPSERPAAATTFERAGAAPAAPAPEAAAKAVPAIDPLRRSPPPPVDAPAAPQPATRTQARRRPLKAVEPAARPPTDLNIEDF